MGQLGLLSSIYHHDRSAFISGHVEPVSALPAPVIVNENEPAGLAAAAGGNDLLDLDWSGDTGSPDGTMAAAAVIPGLADLFGSQLQPTMMTSPTGNISQPMAGLDDLFAPSSMNSTSANMNTKQNSAKKDDNLDWML